MTSRNSLSSLFAAICCALVVAPSQSLAASASWTGVNSALWSDVGNWSASPVPGTGDTATFNGPSANTSVDIAPGVTVNTILFDTASAVSYSVGLAAQVLTLDNGGAVTMNASVVSNQTIGANVVLGPGAGSFTITNNSANLLTFGGTVTGAAGAAQTLTVAGSGNTNINGLLNDGAGAGSILSLVKQGAGYLKLSAAGAPANNNIEGTLDIQGGTIGATGDLTVRGLSGTGTLENGGAADKWFFPVINSGSNTFNGILRNGGGTGLLGLVKQGVGTLVLTNNANNLNSNLSVDAGKLVINNTGTYGSTLAGGVLRTGHTSVVGNVNNANGILEINGANVVWNNRSGTAAQDEAFRGTVSIGTNGAGRQGVLRLKSGSLSLYRQLAIGASSGATANVYGAYRQTGGNTTIGGFLAIGLGISSGVFNQSAGTFTSTTGPMTIGAANSGGVNANGVVNLTGSAVFSQNAVNTVANPDTAIWIGENGNGVVNVSDSATLQTTVLNNGIQLGRNAAGNGTLNLNGGTTLTKAIFKGAGTGNLNLNGGVLEANQDNTTFVSGLTNAFVRPGGAIIQTSAFNVTIPQALLAPINTGITTIPVLTGGSGYIDAPYVTFTGGTGSVATAIANMVDDGSGNGTFSVASISLTNPGDYTVLPSAVNLLGGGNGAVAATLGPIASALNGSGGLTKEGPGTLTLTGANTYAGHTTVNGGLLSISSAYLADLSNVILANGTQMNLNFVGTDTINALYLGGVGQAAGTWGATGSAAMNINDTYFTGTGVLFVSVPEPSSCLLALGGVLAMVSARRNRR